MKKLLILILLLGLVAPSFAQQWGRGGGGVAGESYDETTGSDLVTLLNPAWSHYTDPVLVIDKSNLDNDSSSVAIDMTGYHFLAIHSMIVSGAADNTIGLKVWATLDATASAANTTDWVDVSLDVLGVAIVQVTDATSNELYVVDAPTPYLKYRIVVTASDGASGNNSIDIIVKKSY